MEIKHFDVMEEENKRIVKKNKMGKPFQCPSPCLVPTHKFMRLFVYLGNVKCSLFRYLFWTPSFCAISLKLCTLTALSISFNYQIKLDLRRKVKFNLDYFELTERRRIM